MSERLAGLEPEEIVRLSVIEVLNRGNIDHIEEFYHDDATFCGPGGETGSLADLKDTVQTFHTAFSPLETHVRDVIADGDSVACYYTGRGVHTGALGDVPPTGEEMEASGIGVVVIDDGRISHLDLTYDRLGMFQQLGIV